MMLKNAISICLVISVVSKSFAYNFGEHKDIGNRAMSLFFSQNKSFGNSSIGKCIPISFDSLSKTFIFSDLSIYHFPISYGTVNGLSGDHAENPLILEEQLMTRSSSLLKIISLHDKYISTGFSAAPDGKLNSIDGKYAFLALKNLSHFYEYGKGLKDNIAPFDIGDIDKIINPSSIISSFNKLEGTNAINMYITIHTAAIYLAEIAGVKAKTSIKDAKKYLYYSFLYNAFADHYLEDAFSAGHLLVKRSILTTVVNNKPLHDFYSRYGTEVINLRGEKWKEYGDGFYNQYHNAYSKEQVLQTINYPTETEETNRVIQAVTFSISELQQGFERGYQKGDSISFITKSMSFENNTVKCAFFINNFYALRLIPLPYNTNLNEVMPDSLANDRTVKEVNKLPYYRNFVRSRIANSFILGLNFGCNPTSYRDFTLRLNLGLIKSKFEFNPHNTKSRVVDIWHGYTISCSKGSLFRDERGVSEKNWMLKGGIRSNYDFWITHKRFLGLYIYNEVGLQDRNSQKSIVFVPQLGIHLGSLFNINYYNMPMLVRLPAQYLLPLKFHTGLIVSNNNAPVYYTGGEIDVSF